MSFPVHSPRWRAALGAGGVLLLLLVAAWVSGRGPGSETDSEPQAQEEAPRPARKPTAPEVLAPAPRPGASVVVRRGERTFVPSHLGHTMSEGEFRAIWDEAAARFGESERSADDASVGALKAVASSLARVRNHQLLHVEGYQPGATRTLLAKIAVVVWRRGDQEEVAWALEGARGECQAALQYAPEQVHPYANACLESVRNAELAFDLP